VGFGIGGYYPRMPSPRPASRSTRGPAALLLALLAGSTAAAGLEPSRVGWSALRLGGSKLFISADARLEAAIVPAAAVAATLRTPPEGIPVAPGATVLRLTYTGAALGRTSAATLLMDPRTAAGLQRVQQDFGSRPRYREYRYTDRGAWHWTRWPEGGEAELAPARWSKTSAGLRAFDRPADCPVLEPTGLIWAVAAAPLAAPGDRARFLIFQRRILQPIEVEVAGLQPFAHDYADETGGATRRVRGRAPALRLLLRGDPRTAGSDDELELLGLRGDLELWLDPATRAPLQLSGNVAVLGRVTLRLRSLRRPGPLAEAPPAP
jgi:hypothetical protein